MVTHSPVNRDVGKPTSLYSVMYAMASVPPQTLTLDMPMYTSQRNVDVTCLTKLFTLKVDLNVCKMDLIAHIVVHSRTRFECKYINYGKTVTDRWYLKHTHWI